MASRKQRSAAKRNVKKAQAGAKKKKKTLKNLPKRTKTALGDEGTKVRSDAEKSRQQYSDEARGLGTPGRSKPGKADLKRAVQRRRAR